MNLSEGQPWLLYVSSSNYPVDMLVSFSVGHRSHTTREYITENPRETSRSQSPIAIIADGDTPPTASLLVAKSQPFSVNGNSNSLDVNSSVTGTRRPSSRFGQESRGSSSIAQKQEDRQEKDKHKTEEETEVNMHLINLCSCVHVPYQSRTTPLIIFYLESRKQFL